MDLISQNDMPTRRFLYLGFAITLLALLLRAFLFRSQPVMDDDFFVALSAINYTETGVLGPTMWNHPALRSILIYYAMLLFGTGAAGVKGVSLLMGTLCTPLIAAVGRRIFRNDRIALLAAFLWAVDTLAIDFSRQAINDIYLAFFPMLAIWLVYRFRESGKQLWLVGGGIVFGLGLASKWSVVFPMTATFVLLAAAIWRDNPGSAGKRVVGCLHAAALLLVVPVLVYVLTFVPWFARGYSLPEWGALQKSMFLETSQHTGYKPKPWVDKDNRAYKWFLLPPMYVDPYMNMDVGGEEVSAEEWSLEKNVTVLLAVGNPLVWMLVLPGALLATWRGVRRREEGICYLAGLFWLSYLPLAATMRPIWLNTAVSVLPYVVMLAAFLAWNCAAAMKKPRAALGVYFGLVFISSLLLYPLVIGEGLKTPVVRDYLQERFLPGTGGSAPGGTAGGNHGPNGPPSPASPSRPSP